jgi:hypothetical protein
MAAGLSETPERGSLGCSSLDIPAGNTEQQKMKVMKANDAAARAKSCICDVPDDCVCVCLLNLRGCPAPQKVETDGAPFQTCR